MRNGDHEFPRHLHRQMALIAKPLIGDNSRTVGPGAQPNRVGANPNHNLLTSSNCRANALRNIAIGKIEGRATIDREANPIVVHNLGFEHIHRRLAHKRGDKQIGWPFAQILLTRRIVAARRLP